MYAFCGMRFNTLSSRVLLSENDMKQPANIQVITAIPLAASEVFLSISEEMNRANDVGGKFFNYMDQVIYLMIWIVGFWVIGGVITSHKVKKGIY